MKISLRPIVALVIFGLLCLFPPSSKAQQQLIILKAIYSAGGVQRDVTTILNNNVRDGRLLFDVTNNALGGDPSFGKSKTLNVVYRDGGRDFSITVKENAKLTIPSPQALPILPANQVSVNPKPSEDDASSKSPQPSPTTPAPFDYEALAGRKQEWPDEVALTKPMNLPVMIAGKQSGFVQAPTGTILKVTDVGKQLTVLFKGSPTRIPLDATDLAARALSRRQALQEQDKRDAAKKAVEHEKQMAQEKLAEVTERPPPGELSEPGKHVMRIHGKVLQVIPNGVLLTPWSTETLDPVKDSNGVERIGYSGVYDIPLLIVGVDSGYVDGSNVTGVVYPAGTTSYTSVLGAGKTVLRYATSPELALRLLNSK